MRACRQSAATGQGAHVARASRFLLGSTLKKARVSLPWQFAEFLQSSLIAPPAFRLGRVGVVQVIVQVFADQVPHQGEEHRCPKYPEGEYGCVCDFELHHVPFA